MSHRSRCGLSPDGGTAVTGGGATGLGVTVSIGDTGPGSAAERAPGPGAACPGPVSPPGAVRVFRLPALRRSPGGPRHSAGLGWVLAVSLSVPASAVRSVTDDSKRRGHLRPLAALRGGQWPWEWVLAPRGVWVWQGTAAGVSSSQGCSLPLVKLFHQLCKAACGFGRQSTCWRALRLQQPKMLLHPGRGNQDQALPAFGASWSLQPKLQAEWDAMWASAFLCFVPLCWNSFS